MNVNVATLLEKEVSRKEFLSMSGLAVASIFGFGSAVKLLTGKSLSTHAPMHQGYGYGSSVYGGASSVARH